MSRLHARGFTVTVWIVPFAEPSSEAYAEGAARGFWLKAADGTPLTVTWWQVSELPAATGFGTECRGLATECRGLGTEYNGLGSYTPPLSAACWQGEGVALNVSDTGALGWFAVRLRALQVTVTLKRPQEAEECPKGARVMPMMTRTFPRLLDRLPCRDGALQEATGVDGFKFDAGEAMFVPEGVMDDANAFCGHWARFAATFGGGGEVRCAHQSQDAGLWTREFDKDSRWGLQNGLRALITTALHLGVLGYPFVLPDMVGGNAYSEEMTSRSLRLMTYSDGEAGDCERWRVIAINCHPVPSSVIECHRARLF